MFGLHRQIETDTVFIAKLGLHRQIETTTVCSSQCLGCTDRNRHCVHRIVWFVQTDRNRHCVHRKAWVAQTDRNNHCVFIAVFGLHRQIETDTMFIAMFGLHRQIETGTVHLSQYFGCTDGMCHSHTLKFRIRFNTSVCKALKNPSQ